MSYALLYSSQSSAMREPDTPQPQIFASSLLSSELPCLQETLRCECC